MEYRETKMNSKTKGKEFFDSLSEVERDTVIKIIQLENNPERLDKINSIVLERQIKELIIKNSVELSD